MKKLKKQSLKVYDSLDMPVFYWHKVIETMDYSYLLFTRGRLTKKLFATLEKIWEKIYDEYLQEFGLSDSFISLKEKEIELAQMKIDFVLSGDRSLLTWIELSEIELIEMKKSTAKADFMQSKIAIESHFKFQINMMQTSVREFYSYIKNLK